MPVELANNTIGKIWKSLADSVNKLMFLHVQNLCFPIPLNMVTASFTDSNGVATSILGLFVITVSSA